MKKYFSVLLLLLFMKSISAQEIANFGKYANDNAKIVQSKKPVKAVFMGDSITEFWGVNDPQFFTANNFVNRGISGQTSTQMLLRFRNDVIQLRPKMVFIMAGTNDIAENLGPISLEDVFGNIVSMVELAKFNYIKPVILLVLPARIFGWNTKLQPADKIVTLNSMLKDYAAKNHIDFVDMHTAMKTKENGLNLLYTGDEVHPNLAGYKKMEEILPKKYLK